MFIASVARPQVPINALHQILWGYFPGVERGDDRPFVYRVERDRILLLSRREPACPALPMLPRIVAGRSLQFEVLASAANSSKQQQRRRVPITGNAERRAWLARRMDGAVIQFVQVFDRPDLKFKRPGGESIVVSRFSAVGVLRIIDRAIFVSAMLRGIGGRGCWGCGLLVLPELIPEFYRGNTDRHRTFA